MKLSKWARDNWGLLIIALLTAVFSPVAVDILPNGTIVGGVKFILIAGYVVLAVAVALSEAARQQAERRLQIQGSEVEDRLQERLHGLLVRGGLLHAVSQEVSELLSELRRELVEAAAAPTIENYELARQRSIRAALQSLCKVLSADRTKAEDDRLAATYFKATLFEWDGSQGKKGVLRRAYWHYPATKRPQTESFDLHNDWNSGAAQCYLKGTVVVMQRVSVVAAEGKVWKDMRDGQREEYANSSMVCVPIWADRDVGRDVNGVVTIDTNILDYFRNGEEEIGFMNELFSPFLAYIRLVYSVTRTAVESPPRQPSADSDSEPAAAMRNVTMGQGDSAGLSNAR